MFYKILTIITLVKICSGGTPTYPLEQKSNQASYSQSFVREDIPLSYQYSAVHVYTPKQNLNSKPKIPEKKLESQVLPYLTSNNKPGLNPLTYPVQYAPIPYKREDYKQQNGAGLYTQLTSPKYYDENEVLEQTKEYVRKPQIEPELELSTPTRRPPPQAFNQFVPGHNIHVLPTPNRSPVSNNYHKIIDPQTLQVHPNMENFLRQFTIRHETEKPVTHTFTPKVLEYFTITTENPTKPPFAYVPVEYYNNFHHSLQQKENDIQHLRQPQVLQPMPLRAKDNQLQLNVARGVKVAQMSHQALKHGHFHAYPLHTEAMYKPNTSILDTKSHQNATRLYPMGNQLQMTLYRES